MNYIKADHFLVENTMSFFQAGHIVESGVPNEKNFKSDWISLPVIF